MTGQLLEREVALAGIALVATLAVLALGKRDEAPPPPGSAAPVAAEGRWLEATVGTYGPGFFGQTTQCGVPLRRATRGVAHPTLPCGVRLVVENGDRQAETRVVDRGSHGEGQEFALTQALADDLGVSGTQIVRWRFSSGDGSTRR